MAALLACALGASAQTELTESQAKASALFNFARYVEWPESAFATGEAPFVFCLAGRDSLAAVSSALQARTLHQRTTQVRRVFGSEDLRGCNVLFIGEAEERRMLPNGSILIWAMLIAMVIYGISYLTMPDRKAATTAKNMARYFRKPELSPSSLAGVVAR